MSNLFYQNRGSLWIIDKNDYKSMLWINISIFIKEDLSFKKLYHIFLDLVIVWARFPKKKLPVIIYVILYQTE